jgi:hypothetical protein
VVVPIVLDDTEELISCVVVSVDWVDVAVWLLLVAIDEVVVGNEPVVVVGDVVDVDWVCEDVVVTILVGAENDNID